MKRPQHGDMFRGILFLLLGLFMLFMAVLAYIDDSRGKEMTSLSVVMVVLVCLFWIVGGILAGRRLLEPNISLAEKLFTALFVMILSASQVGVFLVPDDSPSQIQFYLARDLMISGSALWFGGLFLSRALSARGKRLVAPPLDEQE